MVEHEEQCEECGSMDTYEAECDDTDCPNCGYLYYYCNNCGYTDHECNEEES